MGGDGRSEVSAGGGTHDADVARVQVPDGRAVAHDAHGLLGVADGQGAVPVGDAVVHQGEGDALAVEELVPGRAFVRVGQDGVAAAGAADDRPAGGILGQIDNELGHAVVTQREGELTRGLGACGQAEGRREGEEDNLFHGLDRMVRKQQFCLHKCMKNSARFHYFCTTHNTEIPWNLFPDAIS